MFLAFPGEVSYKPRRDGEEGRHKMKRCSRVHAFLAVVLSFLLVWPLACKKKEPPLKEIKIGAILPLTGNDARYGLWIKEGLDLCVNEVNSSGGIDGKSVRIIYEDDQVTPQKAASAMQKLTHVDKVSVVFGSWASSCVLAQAPIAERTRTVIMAQAISPKIRFAGDYVFRCIPDSNHALSTVVPFAFKKGTRKAGVIYVNNDYGRDQAEVFRKKLEELGGEVVFEEGYDLDIADFRTILSKIKNLPVDSIYLPGYTEVGLILRQMKELGIQCQVYSSDPFENEEILKVAGDAADGVFYPAFFVTRGSRGEFLTFINNYRSRYGREPESNAGLAYNGIKILLEAIRKGGMEPKAIKDTLYQFKNYQSTLGNVSIDSYGDITLPVYIKTVKNGVFLLAE
jgi:branched-chain amino acid transport system substrate-binding protein